MVNHAAWSLGGNFLIRSEAIQIICNKFKNQPIISANGFPSRDLFGVFDKKSNFYMIGSMGLASSIGLGVAIKNPRKKIFVFDGDGNILMNLGSLTTIGVIKPKNLVHFVFDNKVHESTGGQPTNSERIDIGKIAKAANYTVFNVKTKNELEKNLKKINKVDGPMMIIVKIKKSDHRSERIKWTPPQIKSKFMNSLKN